MTLRLVTLVAAASLAVSLSSLTPTAALAQAPASPLPMDRVYQGPIRLPDFAGRDRRFADFRTRIRNEMSTGPNFAGHYALVRIGCGTSCSFAFVADVATGEVFDFPFGGEEYYVLSLDYQVKFNWVTARWISGDDCMRASVTWDGRRFTPGEKTVIGPRSMCENY